MNADARDQKEQLFWHLARELMTDPAVSRSTMMGLPCLRLNGAFFASLDTRTMNLVVKLPGQRVAELLESGRGQVFAPNGLPFREWLAVPAADPNGWAALLGEAKAFAIP